MPRFKRKIGIVSVEPFVVKEQVLELFDYEIKMGEKVFKFDKEATEGFGLVREELVESVCSGYVNLERTYPLVFNQFKRGVYRDIKNQPSGRIEYQSEADYS